MRAFVTGLFILILSLGVYALDETVTLEFLLKNSVNHFDKKNELVASKVRGLKAIGEFEGLSISQKLNLKKAMSIQSCRADAYGMLLKISKSYVASNALSSSFITRQDLDIKGDEMLSLYDFFIHPFLEYFNYKTGFLTAQINKTEFKTNDELPFYIEELNIDGYCLKKAKLKHYGENANYPNLEITLPDSIAINDIKRSKVKYVIAEIEELKNFSKSK